MNIKPEFCGTHVALAKAKCDRRIESGQSDPFVALSFAGNTKTFRLQ